MGQDDAPPSVLVVDDDMTVIVNASAFLEDVGFHTIVAFTGDEALGHLEAHGASINLLFTDVEMPGKLDGFSLARIAAERWPSIGVLVASGVRQPREGDLPEGAIFIGKPFSAQIVYDRVHELLPDGQRPEPLKKQVG